MGDHASIEETFTLANGIAIPKLGLGTWLMENDEAARAVRQAVDIGYRHIDTARSYGNEAGVGEAIRSCGVQREELFVTTKLPAEAKSYDDAVAAIEESLAVTGLDYLDLMLIHSPQPWDEIGSEDRYLEGNRQAWKAMEAAHDAGRLRAIGVSNFQIVDIENIVTACDVAPVVNQILVHIGNTPTELIESSQRNGMLVEAYSPIAHGELLGNRRVAEMAERYGVSVAQLSIRYTLQLGLLPLPKTSNPEHMRTNADVAFAISDEDMEFLKHIEDVSDDGGSSAFPASSEG